MAKKVTKTKRVAHNAQITLSFDYENEHIPIDTQQIAYIFIDYEYETNVLPTMYMSLLINDELYDKITDHQETGEFTITIKKFILNSQTTSGKTILKDTFSYIPSNTSGNYMYDTSNLELCDSTQILLFGLLLFNLVYLLSLFIILQLLLFQL